MSMTMNFRIFGNRIPEVTAALMAKLALEVEETVKNIEAAAKSKAPVDTGFLRNSVGGEMLGPMKGRVHVGAEYGAYVNFGTRNTAPNPFFTQAVEGERPKFFERVGLAVKELH